MTQILKLTILTHSKYRSDSFVGVVLQHTEVIHGTHSVQENIEAKEERSRVHSWETWRSSSFHSSDCLGSVVVASARSHSLKTPR